LQVLAEQIGRQWIPVIQDGNEKLARQDAHPAGEQTCQSKGIGAAEL